ncbi:hypothetical protein B0H11DRAFT_2247497 [Mycena galericulata]|nr:hypothetical protein B0H11DRAFT_2247497 [Mycena galericulata]
MVLTRSSSSPRTRTRSSIRKAAGPSSPSSPSPPQRRSTLEAKHAILYPVTFSLRITGSKAVKRRTVQSRLHAMIEVYSPRPEALPHNYQGHRLTGLFLNTGYTSKNDELAGMWSHKARKSHVINISFTNKAIQCEGCDVAVCSKEKPRFFNVVGPLPPHIRSLAPLEKLFRARAELWPKRRTRTAKKPTFPPPSPSPSPSPTPSPEPREASPLFEVEDAMAGRSASPQTPPPHRTLHFDYGGYGTYHYSPVGDILVPTSVSDSRPRVLVEDSDSDEEGELQYPPGPGNVILDICMPVVLFACHVSPPPGSINIGDVILEDFRLGLEAVGLPVGTEIQRFLDAANHWTSTTWDAPIPIFGRNKVIYIRTLGVHVTPPDHFYELLL